MSTDGNLVAFNDLSYADASVGVNAGRVRVFKYENGSWSQRGSSIIGEVTGDKIGVAVQMSEDGKYLITSSTVAGRVYIFEWNGTAYVQRGSTLTGVAGDQFGQSLDISKDGSVIAIGYFGADVAEGALAENSGVVQMYKWNGTNAYTLTATLTSNDADASDQFGSVVRLSADGKRLVAGADSDDYDGTGSGIVYTFESPDGSSWMRREPYASIGTSAPAGVTQTSPNIGRKTAVYVSRDGSTIGIGEYGADNPGNSGTDSGAFRVFNMPSNIKSIWGSNDDTNWTKITTGNKTFRVTDRLEFKNLDNPNYYKYHAIVADAFTRLKDVKLYGIRNQGSSTLHDGALTLTKNLDVPRIGPPLDADDTPRRDRLVVEYNTSTNPVEDGLVQDTSGRGNDIIMHGNAKYDASEKAFRLDGTSGTYMSGTQNLGTGTPAHTITGWFKQLVSLNNWTYVMFIGTSGSGQMSGLLVSSTGQIVFDIYNTRIDTTVDAKIGTWHHFAGVFKGGTSVWNNASTDLYINGQLEGSAAPDSGTQESFNLTGNGIQFGSSTNFQRYFNGSISQFKLYDTALTASEVKTLYDMGRCSNAIPKTLHIMGGMMRFNHDLGKLQIHNGVQWYTLGGVSGSGGTITHAAGYTIHTFTSSGTFTLYSGGDIEYLMIAGGGGGASTHGGAGGAGGMLAGTAVSSLPGGYTITVGGGGAGDRRASGSSANGTNGNNTIIKPWFTGATDTTLTGGGGGGAGYSNSVANSLSAAGSAGGSGGGGGPFHAGGTGTSGQGNTGGTGGNQGQAGHGGGGGGRGGAGGNSVAPHNNQQGISGQGGNGLSSSITGSTIVYAGGGSGGRWGHITTSAFPSPGVVGSVGSVTGGGGLGGAAGANGHLASSGEVNTGGGGGGGSDNGGPGGNGGSGFVVLRYLT